MAINEKTILIILGVALIALVVYLNYGNTQSSSVQTERIKLSRNYGLQDFFNEHKNAKCIVFFLCENTIFHEGYTIRVFVDK